MLVTQVHATGLAAQWNAANPDKQVQAGSIILEVNGKRGAFAELERTIEASALVCMSISRRNPDNDVWADGGRLMLQNFVAEPTLAMSGAQYNNQHGLEEALGKLMSDQAEVEVGFVTFRLLHDLAAARWIPELQQKIHNLRKATSTVKPALSFILSASPSMAWHPCASGS